MTAEHHELVRREFAKQASTFEDPQYSFGDKRLMDWIKSHVRVEPDSVVLDVAAGTGHLARTITGNARQVVAVDLSPEMLSVGKAQAGMRPFLKDGSLELVQRWAIVVAQAISVGTPSTPRARAPFRRRRA